MLAGLINAYGWAAELAAWVEPAGTALLWGCSLALILALMLGVPDRPGLECAPGESNPRLLWSLVAILTGLGLALRLYGREALPYWWDELLAVWIADSNVATIFRTLAAPAAPASDFTPPLFYLILHAWQGVFGTGEGAARVLTAAFSALTIPAVYALGRRLAGLWAGLGAAFLLAVSPMALFYAQQVRSYALLALLALLFLLAAERAREKRTRAALGLLVLCGTLFLYCHFVACWLYAGICSAYALMEAAAIMPRQSAPDVGRIRKSALILAGFLLAAACPLFIFPAGGEAWILTLLSSGAALAAILIGTGIRGESPVGALSQSLRFLIPLAAPGLLFAPWLLTTRIWEVIAGPNAAHPGAYGLPELANLLAAYSGMNAKPTVFLLLLGFFVLCVKKPRAALLLTGWVLLPLVLAMASQNENMNLTRYLFASQAGYVLLLATAAAEAVSLAFAFGRAVFGRAPDAFGRRAEGAFATCLFLLALFVLFGYSSFANTRFPTTVTDIENYPEAAAYLSAKGGVCFGFESRNLSRAISWNLERLGVAHEDCAPGAPRYYLHNAYLDGRPWRPEAEIHAYLKEKTAPETRISNLALSVGKKPSASELPAGGVLRLDGPDLLTRMERGRDAAYVFSTKSLHPLFKKKPGSARYALSAPGVGAIIAKLGIRAHILGSESAVVAKIVNPAANATLAEMRLGNDDGMTARGIGGAGRCEMREGLASCAIPVGEVAANAALSLELTIFDDASGAIYSSEAGVSEVSLSFSPAVGK